jgi:hypothetical protein
VTPSEEHAIQCHAIRYFIFSYKNEIHAILDQNGITYDENSWTTDRREFLADLVLEESAQLLLDQWLELIDDLSEKITHLETTTCERPHGEVVRLCQIWSA